MTCLRPAFLGATAIAAGVLTSPAFGDPYVLERSDVLMLEAGNGDAYQVMVSWPETPPPEQGYPVLFVLDGEDNFATATVTARRFERFSRSTGVGPGIIVGIGSGTLQRRSRDLTPATDEMTDPYGNPIGGAGAYRAFLAETVIPAIRETYDIDDTRLAIFGHSYGGLFVLDTLVNQPGLLDGYYAASASLWFGDELVLKEASSLCKRLPDDVPVRIVVMAGDLEQPAIAEDDDNADAAKRRLLASRRMVDTNHEFAQQVSDCPAADVTYRLLTGEDHGTTSLPALAWAIRYAFQRAPS